MNKKGFNKFVLIPIVVTVIFLALGITLISKGSSSGGNNVVSKIAKEAQKIGAKEMKHGSLPVSTTDSLSVAQELPDIDLEYPLVVQGNGDIDIEIWTSPEKGGSG
ncbi:MAG: hypothetical protein KBT48_01755 [Firmicutes bacterium]|nr:hypothetical protein [Bacillota bacterium]